jgi:transposase
MARWRQAVELGMTDEEIGTLAAIARSRSEAARRVERAQILLTYRENPSFFAVGQRLGVHHQTVQRCVERAMAYGTLAALDDRPRPGKEPTITPEAKAWLVSLACEKGLRVHLHAQARLLAQPHRGLLLQVRPLGSAPHKGGFRNRSSRSASRLVSRTLIATLSSTHGPTSSPRPTDMIRIKETLTLIMPKGKAGQHPDVFP